MHRICITGLTLTTIVQSVGAIVTSDTFGSHEVTPGEMAFGLNLDSVVMIGRLSESGFPVSHCTGTLITDSHVLTAAHCFDEDGDGQLTSPMAPLADSVVLELPSGYSAIEYQVEAVQVPSSWPGVDADIAVLTLDETAPPELPRYPLYADTDEVGQPIVLVGYGAPGHGASGELPGAVGQPTKRAGLNRVDAIRGDQPGVEFLAADFDSGLPENNSLAIFGFESDVGFGDDEVFVGGGDSGGPLFISSAIAGVTSFTGSLPGTDFNEAFESSWGEGLFATRVSGFRQFIFDATNGAAVFVPEPTSWLLVVVGCTCTCTVLRRRSRRRPRFCAAKLCCWWNYASCGGPHTTGTDFLDRN